MSSLAKTPQYNDPLAGAEHSRKFVAMRLEGQLFGVPVDMVQDVLMPQKITPIPLAPAEIKGVLNLRGRIVTAINLRVRLGLPSDLEKDALSRSVVVRHDKELYSLIVDSVAEILDILPQQIERSPDNLSPQWKDVCLGIHTLEKELMVLLDVDKILQIKSCSAGEMKDEPGILQ